MRRVFFHSGALSEIAVSAVVHDRSRSLQVLRGVRIGESPPSGDDPASHYLHYSTLSNAPTQLHTGSLRDLRDQTLGHVLTHPSFHMLAQRVSGRQEWSNPVLTAQAAANVVDNSLAWLAQTGVEALVFDTTPHEPYSWILATTAESLGLPVFMFQQSPLPWRYWVVRGLSSLQWVDIGYARVLDAAEAERRSVDAFIELNTRSYAEAIPPYEAVRLSARNGRLWSWAHEARSIASGLGRIRHLHERWRLYRAYTHQVTPALSKKPNLVVLLHYQPERTSIPEGGMFGQQWLMVESLAASLPAGWVLRVKEHPSTFTGQYRRGYRSPAFFANLATLPSVELVEPLHDTYALVDEASAVATITGTVGVQAIIRGRPVLAFGTASYRDAPGVHAVMALSSVPDAVRAILDSTVAAPTAKDVRDYLQGCVHRTVGPSGPANTLELGSHFPTRERRNVACAHALANLLDRIAEESPHLTC